MPKKWYSCEATLPSVQYVICYGYPTIGPDDEFISTTRNPPPQQNNMCQRLPVHF